MLTFTSVYLDLTADPVIYVLLWGGMIVCTFKLNNGRPLLLYSVQLVDIGCGHGKWPTSPLRVVLMLCPNCYLSTLYGRL